MHLVPHMSGDLSLFMGREVVGINVPIAAPVVLPGDPLAFDDRPLLVAGVGTDHKLLLCGYIIAVYVPIPAPIVLPDNDIAAYGGILVARTIGRNSR